MNTLEKMILDKALVLDGGILKVDMFLNHQIDPHLIMSMGKDFHEHFKNREITKVLTVEASGIPIALATALEFDVPVVFAKKGRNKNVGPDVYTSQVYSYTKGEPIFSKSISPRTTRCCSSTIFSPTAPPRRGSSISSDRRARR